MAKARRIKLVWGSGDAQPGEWRLGLWGRYDRGEGTHATGLAISLRGLLRWLAVLFVAAYLAGAGVLYGWLSRRPYNLVSYADTLLLPVRWGQVREQMGRALIAEGLDDMKAGRWVDGQAHLRAGLARAPHDLRARMELARFYAAINRRPQALKLLTEDLDHGYPGRRYLETLFELATAGEDFALIETVCDRYLAAEPEDRTWLLTRKLQALLGDGRPDEALALAEQEGDTAALIREVRVLALLDLGRGAEAVAYLQKWEADPGAALAQVKRLQVRAYRETKRFAEMDAALEALRQLNPTDIRTYIYGIVQETMAGRTADAGARLQEFLLRFSGTAQNLLALSAALGETSDLALMQRCRDEAALHGFPSRPFDLALVQAQVKAGDWAAASATLVRLKPEPKTPAVDVFVYTLLQRLIAAASTPDDGAQATLVAFIQERPLPMKIYRQTTETLLQAGRYATAQGVLAAASVPYPTSRTLARLRERADREVQAQQAAAAAAATVAAKARASAAAPLEKAFFERIATLARDEKWDEAAQAVREIRVTKPDWLARRDADVLEWQMQIAGHAGDTPELLSATKLFLDASRERLERVLQLARDLRAAGSADDADRLVNEVLRKQPGYPPALRLQREWHPPKPAGTP